MPLSFFVAPIPYLPDILHTTRSRKLSAFVSRAVKLDPGTLCNNHPSPGLAHRDLPAAIHQLAQTTDHRRVNQIKGRSQEPALFSPLGSPAAGRALFTIYTLSAQRRQFSYTHATNCRIPPTSSGLSKQPSGQQQPASTMASDDDYMNFLDKANKDPSEGYTKAQGAKAEFKAADKGASVPEPLVKATQDAFYVSDADEPFVPVALAWDEGGKGLPDEEEFASLIQHWDPKKAEIEIQDPVDWDSRGQYKDIIEAVRKAGKGNDVRVYRVKKDGTRAEYWVVTTEGTGKSARLVGAKALAVES